jgi:uncharacterized membrane protein YjjP (DUF1212 family)
MAAPSHSFSWFIKSGLMSCTTFRGMSFSPWFCLTNVGLSAAGLRLVVTGGACTFGTVCICGAIGILGATCMFDIVGAVDIAGIDEDTGTFVSAGLVLGGGGLAGATALLLGGTVQGSFSGSHCTV